MSYAKSASVYDAIYTAMKNYEAESARVRELIEHYGCWAVPEEPALYDRRILDVACGTGLHDRYLAAIDGWAIDGIDIDTAMLEIARERNPSIDYAQGDMRAFAFARRYDAVTCLFSAIGHMLTLDDLRVAIANMARHLNPGGVLLVEPWIHPDQFRGDNIRFDHVDEDGQVVHRVSRTVRDGNVCILNFDYYVQCDGVIEEPFREVHTVAMYTIEEYLEAFESAGLVVYRDEQGLMGRGLFIGVKPL